jgi:hypothetical protein
MDIFFLLITKLLLLDHIVYVIGAIIESGIPVILPFFFENVKPGGNEGDILHRRNSFAIEKYFLGFIKTESFCLII